MKKINIKKINIKKILKSKKFIAYSIVFIGLLVCLIFILKILLPSGGSVYGTRLNGIEKISFKEKNQNKIVNAIKSDEKVSSAKMNIHGKIINIVFNVNKDVSIDDAKAIANNSLEGFSEAVKGFYDIQFIITKNDEEGQEEKITASDGTETTQINKEFPIMGYKNSKRNDIVW